MKIRVFSMMALCAVLAACSHGTHDSQGEGGSKVQAYGVIDAGYGYTHKTVE